MLSITEANTIIVIEEAEKMTISQIIKAIKENANESILTFEGFNSKRDTELKTELLWTLYEKYGTDKGTIQRMIDKSGKTGEIEAYFLLRYGHITPPKNIDESLSWIDTYNCTLFNISEEAKRPDNHKKVIQILLNRGKLPIKDIIALS